MIKHEQKQAGITHIHNHFIAHSYPVTGVTKLFNFFHENFKFNRQ